MTAVNMDETPQLISADKVKGTEVYNASGEKLGTVEEIMIDKTSGKVAYAVMSFGGFLGMGEKYHPLPWGVLTYDTDEGGYRVELSKEQLQGAPTHGRDERVDYSDPAWNTRIHDYYAVPPAW